MSYTVLARRYRSSTFDEVVGQNHIAQTLKKAIASNRIAHAYLFCGTRGTGKTSTARIFAKALNCESSDGPTTEPCNQCTSCQSIARGEDMDVIEIDAASNTGVDNVRDLIENSRLRPARSRFKIYIIDEVHMLSKSAFNALLKTLEEPPSHVKFILATTEPEKVLPTIQSRCQRYDFRNIPTKEIAGHLRAICEKEGISADDDALFLVAKAGAGSMRDALSLLDRLLSIGEKTLTVEQIEQLLGMPKSQLIFDLAGAIGQGDVAGMLQQADALITSGLSAETLIASLIDHFRNLLILRTCGLKSGLVEVPGVNPVDLDKQAQQFDPVALVQDITALEELRRLIRTSQAGRALLDATLVRLAMADQFASVEDLLARVDGNGSGGGAGGIQKKKPLTDRPAVAGGGNQTSAAAEPSPTAVAPQPAASTPPTPPPAPQPVPSTAAPAVPPPVSLDIDLGDDDDLPAPGKVWENSGPSLSELLKQRQPNASADAQASAPTEVATNGGDQQAPQPPPDANVAPVEPHDIQRIWPLLVSSLKEQGVGMGAALAMARLDRIEDDTAYIRFNPNGATFARMWANNGKRDQIRSLLSNIRGIPTAVQFEVDDEDQPAAPAAAPHQPQRPAPARPARSQPEAPAQQAVEETLHTVPVTPELVSQLRGDPLLAAVMDELKGQIVRVVEL